MSTLMIKNNQIEIDNIIDGMTRAILTIDYAHHEIHGGSSFMYHDVIADLDENIVQDYWFITPDTTKWAHIGHSVESIGPLTMQIYEGADRTNAKTEQVCYNRDRNSATVNTTKIYKNDAVGTGSGGTTDGTLIVNWKGGYANNQTKNGTNVGTSNEKILKQNTKYILRIISGMANNLVSLSFDWYEHG